MTEVVTFLKECKITPVKVIYPMRYQLPKRFSSVNDDEGKAKGNPEQVEAQSLASSARSGRSRSGRAARAGRRSGGDKPDPELKASLSNQRIIGRGGNLNPLDEAGVEVIHQAAITLLSETGLALAPPAAVELVRAAGGMLDDRGRLLFPEKLIEAALAGLHRKITLYGRGGDTDLELAANKVHVGTGGASPLIYDAGLGRYRESTLADIYNAARLVDTLPHIHFFSRPLVARDMPDQRHLDVNTAYASLAGTRKHVIVSAGTPENVRDIARICYQLAGSEEAFRGRPFLSLNINHVVPPLRFDGEAVLVLIEAVRCGIPVMANTFGQLGASSPVTIAGCVAQTTAETLAGMILAFLVDTEAKVVFGPRPMITDLRTGGMAGGSGEQAVLTAASMQMARYYGLPSSTIAGATDSKIPDAQSGYEKCLTVSQTVQAGANIITQACGAQAALMGISLEAMVIDNDMLGAILRATAKVDITPETLDARAIDAVATGAGHFLGEAETYARMHSDFLYPEIADRTSIDTWQEAGSRDIQKAAEDHVRKVLAAHHPYYIDPAHDQAFREDLPVRVAAPPQN